MLNGLSLTSPAQQMTVQDKTATSAKKMHTNLFIMHLLAEGDEDRFTKVPGTTESFIIKDYFSCQR